MTNRDSEILQNYDFFQSVVARLMGNHAGETALIHKREIVGYYNSSADAVTAGAKKFGDEPFSVQEVTNTPVDLGFLSYAESSGGTI